MKTIRALFYVTPKFRWKYVVNWLISIRTMSKYSHCELQDPDEHGKFWTPMGTMISTETSEEGSTCTLYLPKDTPAGTTYSSTMRGKSNGTRKQPASLTLKHPEHWHYVEIPVTDLQYAALIIWMDLAVENNKGYALWDLCRFLSPVHIPDKKRNICSEFCNNSLCYIRLLVKWGIISPKAFLKKLLKLGLEVKPLKG